MCYEGSYLVKEFLQNLWLWSDIAFAQLGVITRTTNKFVEIIVVVESCLIITDAQIKESSPRANWSMGYFIISLFKLFFTDLIT